MKTFLNLIIAGMLSFSAQSFADETSAGTVSVAKAAELALHRIGKLVDLKKIDVTFVSHFYAVQVSALPAGNDSGAAFKASGFLAPGADGKSAKIDILLDGKGKALSHSVAAASVSSTVKWPGKDPLTISENAFHHVLDNSTDPNIKPFFEALTEMNLTAKSGKAIATFKSSKTTKVLVIELTLDGVVTSANVQ